jgi:outer membrane lipoprotein-sorting protein
MRLGLFVLFAASAVAQAKPDAADILAKVRETWKDLKSYDVDYSITLRDPKNGKEQSGRVRVAAAIEPDRYRMELNGTIDASDPALDGATAIYDGSTFSIYLPKRNEYSTSTIAADKLGRDLEPSKVNVDEGIGQYTRLTDRFESGRFLGEETISTPSGARADCFVIGNESGERMWIDKSNYHVLRTEIVDLGGNHSTMVISIKMNEPLSDDLFKFAPPPGARNLGKP